jgi:hypothetical protein
VEAPAPRLADGCFNQRHGLPESAPGLGADGHVVAGVGDIFDVWVKEYHTPVCGQQITNTAFLGVEAP